MSEIWPVIHEILESSFLNAVLITALVVVMMMMIESLNIGSRGKLFSKLGGSRVGGVLLGAFFGVLPGCMGGFATVSLYTHGILSFGALVAMMIASSGDEAFVLLAWNPRISLWIFALLFVVAVAAGILTDLLSFRKGNPECAEMVSLHSEDNEEHKGRHFSWKRAGMFAGVLLFIVALITGLFEHSHGGEDTHVELQGALNLLSEDWMYVFFAVLSISMLVVLVLGSDHFVEEHLWHHVVIKHLPVIFAWTFGVLLLLGVLLNFFDVSAWISDNTALMIVLATLVGIIPESGPHLIFVTLYAAGVLPMPVLLASCISQDGHASLPLLAESKKSFMKAKLINCAVALIVGFGVMAIQ